MRVLYFSDNTSDHNRRFLEKLSGSGLEVWFLDPTSAGVPEVWLPDGVHGIQTGRRVGRSEEPTVFAEFLPELRDWLKEIRPDLIHAGPTHSIGYVTALSDFHPWLLMSWGSDILYQTEQGTQWKEATQLALSSADGLFCDCDAVRDRAKQLADVRDDRIVQLPWGIRQGVFTPSGAPPEKREFGREPHTPVLISTRSWEPLYGIDVLLEAFRLAHRADSSLRLWLLGTGTGAAAVQELIRGNGLDGVIQTPGAIRREDMPKWFRAADVYVSCARSDGTSISLLEAMATGLPVVVRDIPSNREWVVEGQNGWLAESAEEYADRFLLAARLGPERRKLFGIRNQRIVEERADWDRNFPELLRVYERLTGKQVKG